MNNFFKRIIIGVIVIIVLLFFIKLADIAPSNAVVYIDKNDNKYFPEIYYSQELSEYYIKSTIKEVEEQNLEIKEGMYDFHADRNLLFTILRIPIWSHPQNGGFYTKERWNSNGSWNW